MQIHPKQPGKKRRVVVSGRPRKVAVRAGVWPAEPETFSALQQKSLIAQTTEALRAQILKGAWIEFLPGERQLCELLKVSRPTLRYALHQLQSEGLIVSQPNKNRTICRRDHDVKPRSSRRVVILLSSIPASELLAKPLFLVDQVRARLQKAGYILRVESPAWLRYRHPQAYLEKQIQLSGASCWLLLSVSEPVQAWFAASPVPALVVGSCFPGVRLASIDFDYRAIIAHALARVRQKRCQRIVLLVPENPCPGHLVMTAAFREIIARFPAGTQAEVVEVPLLRSKLESWLSSLLAKGLRPCALLPTEALDTLFVLTFLLREKYNIGKTVSVISCDEDICFGSLSVDPAHYRRDKVRFAERLCRLAVKMVRDGQIVPDATLILPEFHPGNTA